MWWLVALLFLLFSALDIMAKSTAPPATNPLLRLNLASPRPLPSKIHDVSPAPCRRCSARTRRARYTDIQGSPP